MGKKTTFIFFMCLFLASRISAASEEDDNYADIGFTEDCCSDGIEWAEKTGKCDPPEDPDRSATCLNTATPCCTKRLDELKSCQEGIKAAKESKNCETVQEGQDCCAECNLGIIMGKSQQCGEPNNNTFYDCCKFSEDKQKLSSTTESTTVSTTPSTTTTTTTTSKPTTKYSPPDLDGCELEGAVLCAHKCVPMGKSYKCQCKNGFKLHTDGKSCLKMDQNRCSKKNPCKQKCTDTGDAIVCSCRQGYELKADNVSCIDIDECRLETHFCKDGTVCVNTQGSHKCVLDPTANEEEEDSDTPASRGACPKGFKLNKQNQVCDDIDECQKNPCPSGRVCVNTVGSFNCGHSGGAVISPTVGSRSSVPKKPKNTEKDIGIAEDNCPPGFMLDRETGECADIDECAEKTDDCNRKSQFCLNTHGGFTCQDKASKTSCPPGFKMLDPEHGCEDIDECAENPDICTPDTACVNEPGGYDCKVKLPTRVTPLPIPNAANSPNPTPTRQSPPSQPPTPSTYKPNQCPRGYRKAANGGCKDINECAEKIHNCDDFQDCQNTMGGHRCVCRRGFYKDPLTLACMDINECQRNDLNDCTESQRCDNTIGSYHCIRYTSCGTGYTLNAASSTCEDDDECALGTHDCYGPQFECVNYPGTYRCMKVSTTTTSTSRPNPDTDYESEEYYVYSEETEGNNTNKNSNNVNEPVSTPQATRPPSYNEVNPLPPDDVQPTRADPRNTQPDPRYYPQPDPRNNQPDPRNTQPDPRNSRPDPRNNQPDPRNTQPDPRNSRPDPRNNQPDPRSSQPDPRYSQPDPRSNQPDPRSTQPDPRYSQPDPRSNQPDPRSTQPDPRYPEQRPSPPPPRPLPLPPGLPTSPSFKDVQLPKEIQTVVGSPDEEGNIVINAKDIPENKWTQIIPGDKTCIGGYIKDNYGQCVDLDECKTGRHVCRQYSELCLNTQGGYTCLCAPGFIKHPVSGLCVSQSQFVPPSSSVPRWSVSTSKSCNIGYQIDSSTKECVDIDECSDGTSRCASNEVCVNTPGGFRCQCNEGYKLIDGRCQSIHRPSTKPYFYPGSRPVYRPVSPKVVVVTSPPRPQCPAGYKPDENKICVDIDECAEGSHTCISGQQCINAKGGYMCRCPQGHRLTPKQTCEDVDECTETDGKSCSPYATCVNTIGSFRCDCRKGFKTSDHSHQLCTDVDECNGGKGPCHQQCINVWGSYRCGCDQGYRLHSDNTTCIDVDECAEHRQVCVGECQNVPGSYKCTCPKGYKMGMDGRSCIDIDECENGELVCGENETCQNIRGGSQCRSVACSPGYEREPKSKHRCSRRPGYCQINDLACLRAPDRYSFNFITFVSKLYIPTGPRPQVDLFTMRAASWNGAILNFELKLAEVRAPKGVERATMDCFKMSPSSQQAVVSLVKSLEGPQDILLELSMELYTFGHYEGTALAKIFIFVSQYEF